MAKANRDNKKPHSRRKPAIGSSETARAESPYHVDHRGRLRQAMAALAWHQAEIERIKAAVWAEIEAVGLRYPAML